MTASQHTGAEEALRRFRWVGLCVPLAVHLALALVQLAQVPALPDPAAIHWGAAGGPDGFGPAWTLPLLTALVGGGTTLLVAGLALVGARGGASGRTRRHGRRMSLRMLAAVIWWEVGLLGVGLSASVFAQVGLDDARDAPPVAWGMAAGFAVGVALGIAAWFVTIDPPHEEGERPRPVALATHERAVWARTASMAPAGIALLAVSAAAVIAIALVTASLDLAQSGALSGGTWITIAAAALVTFLVGVGCVFRVRVDEAGLTVRAPIGWPRVRISASDIRAVEVVLVNPMAEYGGWGWRYAVGSGWGVVLRAGEALRVTRANGKAFTVTVDAADTAVALLAGFAERARA